MWQSLLLALACSLDAFVASIAYGANKIKVPFTSVMIINVVCSSILAISLFFGFIVKTILPGDISAKLSFMALMLLGTFYLFQNSVKAYLAKTPNLSKQIKLKLLDLRLMIDIYVDETKADIDNSKAINSKEAFYLAVALALDSLAVGFAYSLGDINHMQVVLFSLVTDMVAVWAGLSVGRKLVEELKINIAWLSGVILIVLAIIKLYK